MSGERNLGIYVALGSNLGEREVHIGTALNDLADGRARVVRVSRLHETDPVGGPSGQPRYLNAVAELETKLPPRDLMKLLLDIERRHGRVRGERNAARTLDLDLLLYRDEIVNDPHLVVPHPRMWNRAFVMDPLSELCSQDELRAVAARLAACGRGGELPKPVAPSHVMEPK